MSDESGLKELRDTLDNIDNEVLNLIDRLEKLSNEQGGSLNRTAIEALFLEIFAISRNLELPENIAYLGPEGSFTHQAAEARFGAMSAYLPIGSITGVFREVANKKAKFGVIPIENSSNGIVSDTITCFNEYDLKIIAEVMVDIHHTLASTCDKVNEIKKIYSKDIAFDQCHKFLEDLGLDEVELIPVESTAKAAKLAIKEPNSAAICSHVGAKMYNLPILFENIEDKGNNRTRFLIVSDFENGQSGDDKTSILVQLSNEAGALVKFLNAFDEAKINLTKIKSHIVEGKSTFFIEFNAHKDDEEVQKIFKEHSSEIKFLGSYVREADDI
jgi:chorismate mutase/prephenate dehydratase